MQTKINWCLQLKKGIRLTKSSTELSKAYMDKAREAMKTANLIESRDWKVTTSYYCAYFALYSLLTKIGIKCEIHSCSIEFMKRFLGEHFEKEDIKFLLNALQTRTDTQYYVDRGVSETEVNALIENAPQFLIKCEQVLTQLTEAEVQDIRNQLAKLANS